MNYTREAFEAAEETIAQRLRNAEEERQQRVEEIKQKLPEVYGIYNSISRTNFGMISLIGSGRSREQVRAQVEELRQQNLSNQNMLANMLESFGYPEDYLEYKYFCPKCKDRGYREGVRCECFKKLLEDYTIKELNKNCSIELHEFSEFRPEFYPDAVIDGGNARQRMMAVYKTCLDYANNFSESSPSMFFFGKTGLGKTFLSSCIANQLMKNGVNVFFGSLLKLFRQLEDEHFGRREGDTATIINNADFVILDDLGSEFKTQFTEAALYEILNERINTGKPTIVSTNLMLSELNQKYNDRIVSRLTGSFLPLKFIGTDIRLEKRRLGIG